MGRNHKFNKQCRYCGIELTTHNTSWNFINDQNYICYDCASRRMRSGGHKFRNLEQVYDPNKNRIHGEIHRKAQFHIDQIEFEEEIKIIPPKPKEKKYPDPKGRSIIIHGREKECPKCKTILTTTNAYLERVRRGIYICQECEKKDRYDRDNDPLYKEKMDIKSILFKLYARRQLKQFDWEYVEQRFAKVQELKVPQVSKEEYDKIVKLFGEEYATKRFRPKTTNALQESFGDLSTRGGCKRLLALFEYELYKSHHAGRRKQEIYKAQAYLNMFDFSYRMKRNENEDITDPDECITYDKLGEQAYYNEKFVTREAFDKKWDPYIMEET